MAYSSSSNGSATYVVTAPAPTQPPPSSLKTPHITEHPGYTLGTAAPSDPRNDSDAISLGSLGRSVAHQTPRTTESSPPPSATDAAAPEYWNKPSINFWRTLAAFWSLFLTGMNDATYGAVIPYIESYYKLSYIVVSLIFLSPMAGYTSSAILNPWIHSKFGQRGVAIITPLCHIVAYIIVALHPPFPVLVVVYLLAGFGNGLADAAWNAWIGAMVNPNQLLGFLHALYGAGATVAPLAASGMIVQGGMPWYQWYWVMLGGAVVELVTGAWAFWGADGKAYRDSHPRTGTQKGSRLREALTDRKSARVIWLMAFFLLGYVGAEVALGGWIVLFMIRERAGAAFDSGVVATGFWLGITLGRLVLGFVTPRVGEKLSITIYLPLAAGLQLIFWLVPSFTVSAVAVALQGFFLGPMFPAAVVACTKLLPKHLHVSGIGFAAAFGGSGGAIFPFAIGALAQAKGVQVLQPIILALLVSILLLWLGLPKIEKKKD
ncbi:MFS transporter-like protein 148 [Elsinoe australis]|uniref:MFS transporter-like protein 148 n=1 Tax=Elsinoe australis TaxID=40998 RepID=A0A4V6DUK9_9PEZI|nr:MFS transporter-like protein 148 [Elsinoe australis]